MRAMAILVEYPFLAALIGIGLVALGRVRGRRVPVGVGLVWLLYSVYELGMQRRWLCTGECDIRIDLLVIYPALLVGLIIAGISLLRRPKPPV